MRSTFLALALLWSYISAAHAAVPLAVKTGEWEVTSSIARLLAETER